MAQTATKEDLFDRGVNPLGNKETGALRAFVERIETVQTEIDEFKNDQKTILDEASGAGFDKKAIRRIVAIRKKDREKWKAEQNKVDAYLEALGLA